ncbi:MAG: acyl-ACP--UDP-N-acetylglucosamine O-acyltransferase [Verrucomicrobiota bacterium]
MSNRIHPTAVIEDGVVLGDDCHIHPLVVLRAGTVLGDRVTIHAGTVIGGEPQALSFDPATPSGVRIGDGTTIREHVTINRAMHAGVETTVGANCFLMACSHLGHDCAVADNVILANNALLAGHVAVGAFSFVGGGAAVHQFSRIGESAMIGGLARITRDIPPFTMTAERDELVGLNLVGLRRRGFPRETIAELKSLFRELLWQPGNVRALAAAALAAGRAVSPEATRFLEFLSGGKRGFVQARRLTRQEGQPDA